MMPREESSLALDELPVVAGTNGNGPKPSRASATLDAICSI